MPRIDVVVETPLSRSPRVRQLEAMFDVPPTEKCQLSWNGEIPIDTEPWNVGLIVGPSGSGKTTVVRHLYGEPERFDWSAASVIDDFPADKSMQDIAAVCQAVGFNTIPAWMRPYSVLSNGEQFRVDLARRLMTDADPIVVDEFTSVVDRQVAKIGSHAVQKFIRRANRRFVAVTCHYDVIDWLQPDWVFEPATMTFQRRSVQRRPELACSIRRVDRSLWRVFAPYHYMSADLNPVATCFALFVGEQPVSFTGVLHRPHAKVNDIKGVSRIVTLPDWQGLGLAMALADTVASAYKALGFRFRNYPAHPAYIRTMAKSINWSMEQKPGGTLGSPNRASSGRTSKTVKARDFGGRPNAVFEYRGASMDRDTAALLLAA